LQTPLAGCIPRSEIYNLDSLAGVLAQLVERLNGIEEVTGSNPVGSIPFCFQLGGDCEAGNSTGTLTQRVFNELARLIRDRLSDTNYTHHIRSRRSSSFPGNHTNVYQALRLNFYVGPRLTFGRPP
jgi:hypothetical protein